MISFIKSKLIQNWRDGFRMYTTWFHLLGLIFSGGGVGLAVLYGATDSTQHSLLPPWLNYSIFFIIFLGAAIGKFIRQ